MHGGMKVYRGSPTAARNYVEADRSRADDYYLAEGTGLADRYVASPSVGSGRYAGEGGVRYGGTLDGDAYETWVAGYDQAGRAKGRLRTDGQAVRFVEVVVNGPKTWSLAAALHPEIAAAYDAAQDCAAREIIGWLAEHATTRVGPRGRQVQVPVEEIEAAVVRHYTSRAGDPHRHLHLQINARVRAAGGWRGIHTVGVRDSLETINGIGHAAVLCDPRFRAALASHGYTIDLETGEVTELADYAGAFSARASQIGRNVDRYEAEWRAAHPDQEPGPRLRRSWDTRAWAEARPDKVIPRDGAELAHRWVEELHELGFQAPVGPIPMEAPRIGQLNRTAAAELALARLGARRSAWNAADVRGEVERLIAQVGIVADAPARTELAEDLTARVLDACVRLLEGGHVPEHVRALTSPEVLAVEADLTTRLTNRLTDPAAASVDRIQRDPGVVARQRLDGPQRTVAEALAGEARLLVIEGAAGAGKTTTLAAARELLEMRNKRLVVVTPTRKAAAVATRQVGTDAFAAAWLVHQHGFRWDADGRWSRLISDAGPLPPDDARARLLPGDLLLVDEAGMLDQDTARALLTIADGAGARLALVGDRHQLPAVGRGGVLDLAARWAPPEAHLTLDAVHRFTDPEYAELTRLMRTGERAGEVFDTLLTRGEVVIHASDIERQHALAELSTNSTGNALVIADTREQVATLNATIRDVLFTAGVVDDSQAMTTDAGERIGLGDRVATRRNDRDLDVANRDTWTVTGLGEDGGIVVSGRSGERVLPEAYVCEHLELAYASTVYGVQGETTDSAHLLIGDHTGAASAYVGMTRGRHTNTAHLVADSVADARRQWLEVFGRDRADLGPTHAAQIAAEDIDRYGTTAARPPVGLQAAALKDLRDPGPRRPHELYPSTHRPARSIGR
jgi:exodeoxyribonuclease V alpha subunit